jgi:hypothetical protein
MHVMSVFRSQRDLQKFANVEAKKHVIVRTSLSLIAIYDTVDNKKRPDYS